MGILKLDITFEDKYKVDILIIFSYIFTENNILDF